MASTDTPLQPAVVHVDLDGAPWIYGHHGWSWSEGNDPIFESGMEHLLSFLDENHLRATLFVIAADLDSPEKCAWLRRAVEAGHEIASHTLTHPEFDGLEPDARRREIAESRTRLEDALQTPVVGFRMPNYQIDRDSFEMLAEAGYRWDSSVFADRRFARRLRVPSIRPGPHRPVQGLPLLELPLPGHRPSPFPWNPSYALLLGRRYFEACLARFSRNRVPMVMLFHLIDFCEPLPRHLLPGAKARVFTLAHRTASHKRVRCQAMVDRVRQRFVFTDTPSLVASVEEATAQPVMLGISTTHETGACVTRGQQVLAAISEERLDRTKFSTAYPPVRSIEKAIEVAGVRPEEIGDVVIGGLPPERLFGRMLRGQLRDTLEFHGFNDYFPHFNRVLYRAFFFMRSLGYRRVLGHLKKKYGIEPRIHFVAHHLCHASSAYRTAPFDDALIVTADGVGDDISVSISAGRGGRIELLKLIPYPHSFGQFYTACTQVLGFRGGRHEGKITGLSGFGSPDPELYAAVKGTIRQSGPDFRLDKRFYSEGFVRGFSRSKIQANEDLFEALQYRNYKAPLKRLLEGHSRENVAAVFQKLLEEEIVAMVRPFVEQTGLRNLCLAGGVFANVKVNAALFRALGMEQVYVFPHMGDGGLGVGGILEVLQSGPEPFDDVYWGPEYDEAEMEAALQAAASGGLRYRREADVERSVAELVAEKKVVARFSGRMEFGPRALCHRSILYRASDPGANTWLNNRLGRTEFMPFAPVVLEERAPDLFKAIEGAEHTCKFMTIILDCTDWTKEHCPAIVHVDGTARPQFVSRQTDPGMHRILSLYEGLTGVPLMVNTSFNMHEEPIVCSPEDAVRAYLDSKLDALALGPFVAWLEPSAEG